MRPVGLVFTKKRAEFTPKYFIEIFLVSFSSILTYNNFDIGKMITFDVNNDKDNNGHKDDVEALKAKKTNKTKVESQFHKPTLFKQIVYLGIFCAFNLM